MIIKYIIYISAFLFLSISCFNKKQEEDQIQNTAKITINSNSKDLINSDIIQGKKELSLFKNKYENNWEAPPKIFPYSKGAEIKVFELDCSYECFDAEFMKRISPGKIITKTDFEDLLSILGNPNSYNNSTAACYHPKFGLVIYDSIGVPTESMSICLDCNQYQTYPGEINVTKNRLGLSSKARENLRKLFFEWGIDYYGFSSFWDDEKKYEEYIKQKSKKQGLLDSK